MFLLGTGVVGMSHHIWWLSFSLSAKNCRDSITDVLEPNIFITKKDSRYTWLSVKSLHYGGVSWFSRRHLQSTEMGRYPGWHPSLSPHWGGTPHLPTYYEAAHRSGVIPTWPWFAGMHEGPRFALTEDTRSFHTTVPHVFVFSFFFFSHLLFNPAWTPSAWVSPVTGVTSLCTRSGCPLVLRSHTDVFRMTWRAAYSLKYFSSNSNNRKWRNCGKLHPHFQVMVYTLITGVALYRWGSSCDSPPKLYRHQV